MRKLFLLLFASSMFFTVNSMHSDDNQLSKALIGHLEFDYDEDKNLSTSLLSKHASYVPQGDNLNWVLHFLDNLDLVSRSVVFTELLNRTDTDADQTRLFNYVSFLDKELLDLYIRQPDAKQFVRSKYGKKCWNKLKKESPTHQNQQSNAKRIIKNARRSISRYGIGIYGRKK